MPPAYIDAFRTGYIEMRSGPDFSGMEIPAIIDGGVVAGSAGGRPS